MKRKISLQGNIIPYILRMNKRARSVRLTVYEDGTFAVTVPYKRISVRFVERIIRGKSRWVLQKLERLGSFAAGNSPKERLRRFAQHKEEARRLAEDRLRYFNREYGFHFNRIAIRNQRTMWGSCSAKGNLNFNYKIALLPGHLADYIIVHELCHIAQLNHSAKFWRLVAATMPDYSARRNELKHSMVR